MYITMYLLNGASYAGTPTRMAPVHGRVCELRRDCSAFQPEPDLFGRVSRSTGRAQSDCARDGGRVSGMRQGYAAASQGWPALGLQSKVPRDGVATSTRKTGSWEVRAVPAPRFAARMRELSDFLYPQAAERSILFHPLPRAMARSLWNQGPTPPRQARRTSRRLQPHGRAMRALPDRSRAHLATERARDDAAEQDRIVSQGPHRAAKPRGRGRRDEQTVPLLVLQYRSDGYGIHSRHSHRCSRKGVLAGDTSITCSPF